MQPNERDKQPHQGQGQESGKDERRREGFPPKQDDQHRDRQHERGEQQQHGGSEKRGPDTGRKPL